MKRFAVAPALAAALLAATPGCSSHKKPQTSTEELLNERMAAVLLRQGRAHEAEDAYRECLRAEAKKPELHDGLGLALLAQGKTKESLESFDKAVKYDPEKALYRIHRGMVRTQLSRFGEAEEDFKVAENSPSPEDQYDLALNRGRMRLRMGDFVGAEQQFSQAIARDPRSIEALLGRGAAHEARSDYSAAAEDYLEAVKLQPKSPEANLHLGLTLVTMKKTALGRRYLERTIELDPTGDSGAKARLLLEAKPSS
ncbi:MAG TPA: tetratricopeptide repeat protein [Thermoanaerobaculia bacterium]|nr:tetratricopeptide repeat protein [Thermoanaerobaculia bacterium]